MARRDVARGVARQVGCTLAEAEVAVQVVVASMADALAEGRRVEIRGFGSWKPRHYPAYQGRNPASGEIVDVPHKVQPAFRAGGALLQAVQSSPGRST